MMRRIVRVLTGLAFVLLVVTAGLGWLFSRSLVSLSRFTESWTSPWGEVQGCTNLTVASLLYEGLPYAAHFEFEITFPHSRFNVTVNWVEVGLSGWGFPRKESLGHTHHEYSPPLRWSNTNSVSFEGVVVLSPWYANSEAHLWCLVDIHYTNGTWIAGGHLGPGTVTGWVTVLPAWLTPGPWIALTALSAAAVLTLSLASHIRLGREGGEEAGSKGCEGNWG